MTTCCMPGCTNAHKSRWLCATHYKRLCKLPDVLEDWPTLRDGEPTPWDIERFEAAWAARRSEMSAPKPAPAPAPKPAPDTATLDALRSEVADLRAERDRLRADVLQVAQHRDRLECERHDAVTALAEVEQLLRAIYADQVGESEAGRLTSARQLALGLRRVLTQRSEASCKRDGMMHVPRVHLETVASVLSRAADELEPWQTGRDGVVGLMVRAAVDHLETMLEAP